MAVQGTTKLTDVQVIELEKAIKKGIEVFQKDNEFFDKYCNHIGWDAKAKQMTVRRVIKPKVTAKPTEATEDVAPRPQKFGVERFVRQVGDYRDRINYTAEEVIYGYDDIEKICVDTMGDITTQKLDYIKGDPFFKSPCVVTYDTSILKTLAKTAIILQKNKAKPFADNKFACILTPEDMEKLRAEVEAKGASLPETVKEELAKLGVVTHYGKWLFIECSHNLMYNATGTKTNMVCFGRRPDGTLPVDCAKKHEVEVIYNALGTGVMTDEDGNITDDANKQRGSIAVNVIGLGAYINDDLCIINIELTTDEVKLQIAETDKTGFDALAPQDIEITVTAGQYTQVEIKGARKDASTGKYYATANTIIKAIVTAVTGKTLGNPATGNFTVTSNKGAKVVAELKTTKNYDTCLIELTNDVKAFTLTSTVTAS